MVKSRSPGSISESSELRLDRYVPKGKLKVGSPNGTRWFRQRHTWNTARAVTAAPAIQAAPPTRLRRQFNGLALVAAGAEFHDDSPSAFVYLKAHAPVPIRKRSASWLNDSAQPSNTEVTQRRD